MTAAMHILIVDDEALARKRLRTLLAQCQARLEVSEAAHGAQALALLQQRSQPVDLLLLDIHMPGLDGLALAQALGRRADAPAIVFVTAHAQHALSAFELDAVDYLTKPVRLERLQQALLKAQRGRGAAPPAAPAPAPDAGCEVLLIQDRGRAERLPLAEVLYLKAELKYLTVRTAQRTYVLDGALQDFEARHPAYFLRVHRNALVARHAVRALEKHCDPEEGDCWAVRLHGLAEPVAVSRRQMAAVREVIAR